ncbi:MAG: adenylate/guanylate cyclase domain-containing protein [Pseudomonadota bacterium]
MPATTRLWNFNTLLRPLILSLLVAVLGVVVLILPLGQYLEEEAGLALLFKERGARPAPDEVVVVPIEYKAAAALDVANDPARWPRRLHARLIDQLRAAGAATVTFDIHFKEPRDAADDAALSAAIRRAGNVVLFAYLEREAVRLQDDDRRPVAGLERVIPPVPSFAEAAARVAPFALPKVPARVNHFWTLQHSAGGMPTLPLATLEQYSLPALRSALARAGNAEGAAFITLLDTSSAAALDRLRGMPELLERLGGTIDSGAPRPLTALRDAYRNDPQPFINFYGPPRSITTLRYDEIINGDPAALAARIAGKAVFVGFAEQRQPLQRDGFYTVFSQEDGLDLSGVEIAATAFANLLHREVLHPPATLAMLLLVIIYGGLITFVCRHLPAPAAIAAGLALAGGYYAVAAQLFDIYDLWVPLVIPLFIQTPLALFLGLFGHYWLSHHQRRQLQETFGQFVPKHVVDRLLAHRDGVHAPSEHTFGICLATDAACYTSLAETLQPAALSVLMNDYYQILFKPVRERQGIISDVVGDAMLAIWPSPQPDTSSCAKALAAALDIQTAVGEFCRQASRPPLPTRIGLHCGDMVLGNIGALDHFEYRAVGDIVNTANRIQSLNKILGTSVLVSADTLAGMQGFVTRPLGAFLLAGKSQSVVVHELIGRAGDVAAAQRDFIARFAQALHHFGLGQWSEARAAFASLRQEAPDDGPSRYFAARCEQYVVSPPADWRGVLTVEHK